MAVMTVRLVKSFEYRNVRNVVLKDLELDMTLKQLMSRIQELLSTDPLLTWSKNTSFDTLKLYVQAFGAKSQHLVINFGNDDELVLLSPTLQSNLDKTLGQLGCKNETELSLFDKEQYQVYKMDPKVLW
jgi:hypothetical protein